MVDPISIAGLTVTIFDHLLKLGERTAELISDVRAFNDDSKRLHERISNENHKTRTLKQLLFEDAPAYGGQALFEQFDEDVQNQINLSLGQLVSVLQEAFDLLSRRYSFAANDESFKPSTQNVSPTSDISKAATVRKNTRSPFLMVRWSFRDKKRADTIVSNFAELNCGIHEHIKLLCLGSSVGIDIKHLERLQNDKNSQDLGFNTDATLRLTSSNAKELPGTLELPDVWTKILGGQVAPYHFVIFEIDGTNLLRENRVYEGRDEQVNDLDPITRSRVDALAKLLHQPKEQVFRIPRCRGWKYIGSQKRIAFVFENPSAQSSKPISLQELVASNNEKPSLGSKFLLAHGLAKCVAQLHMVRWLHESFCSENILFFPTERGSLAAQQGSSIDYSQPWVLGFDMSRPEGELSLGPAELYPERDVYRHPERQGQVQMQFTKLHDIYALGVVLLEIGLWAPAVSLQSNRFATAREPKVIRDQLVKHAERRLASHLGNKYRDLVLKCLTGEFGVSNDTKEDLKLQQAFRSQIVDVLKRAAENV